MPEFELSGTTRAMPLPVWAAKKVASTRKRPAGETERRRRGDAAAVFGLGRLAEEKVIGRDGVVARQARRHRRARHRPQVTVTRAIGGRAGKGDAEEGEGLIAARRRNRVAAERLAVDAEVLDRRPVREVDVGEHSAEARDHGRPVGAGDEELHLVDRVAERGEEALGREGSELRGVGRIEIREDDRRRGGVARLGAHREEVAGAVEEDRAAGGGEIEEVGGQQVGTTGAVGDAVPVDLAADAAERAVAARDRAAAQVGAKGVARGGDGGEVAGGGADDLRMRGRAREQAGAGEGGEQGGGAAKRHGGLSSRGAAAQSPPFRGRILRRAPARCATRLRQGRSPDFRRVSPEDAGPAGVRRGASGRTLLLLGASDDPCAPRLDRLCRRPQAVLLPLRPLFGRRCRRERSGRTIRRTTWSSPTARASKCSRRWWPWPTAASMSAGSTMRPAATTCGCSGSPPPASSSGRTTVSWLPIATFRRRPTTASRWTPPGTRCSPSTTTARRPSASSRRRSLPTARPSGGRRGLRSRPRPVFSPRRASPAPTTAMPSSPGSRASGHRPATSRSERHAALGARRPRAGAHRRHLRPRRSAGDRLERRPRHRQRHRLLGALRYVCRRQAAVGAEARPGRPAALGCRAQAGLRPRRRLAAVRQLPGVRSRTAPAARSSPGTPARRPCKYARSTFSARAPRLFAHNGVEVSTDGSQLRVDPSADVRPGVG